MKKRLISLSLILLAFGMMLMPVSADDEILYDDYDSDAYYDEYYYDDAYTGDNVRRVVDDYDLLDDEEEAILTEDLDLISTAHQCDVVVVTVYSLGDKTPTEYADDFFDYNGYGFGDSRDGILLLVSMEERDWAISTSGYAIEAFTDAGLEYVEDEFVHYLSEGYYLGGFLAFADACDECLTQAASGEPYDIGNMPEGYTDEEPMNIVKWIFIALGLGLVIAFIPMMVLRAQVKNVKFKSNASDYVKQGSMHITQSNDQFLYRHVDRRLKPQDSGGGSSTHISSSGSSHGGSSGKF